MTIIPQQNWRDLNSADTDQWKPGPISHSPKWPQPLNGAALHGIVGEYVRLVDPASEADQAALLLQFLIGAGNVIGHRPHYQVEDTRHYLNLYTVLVGMTSKSRKGTSWGRVEKLFAAVDEPWTSHRISDGLSSGEGVIEAVRDPSGNDEGIADKRLLVSQGEFCGVLRVMERNGNTLAVVLRNAWDGRILSVMNRKNNALRSTDSHISIVGHITRDELRTGLTETDKANGFANRFLWACVGRSKVLPDEIEIDQRAWDSITHHLKSVMGFVGSVDRIHRSEDAKDMWRSVYGDLSEGHPGMFGAVTSRAEAQVIRLSCLYALLGKSANVEAEHLAAALEVWRYCEDSARYIFGDQLGNPVADAILLALKEAGEGGLTRTQLHDLFRRHKSAEQIGIALGLLKECGLAANQKGHTNRRPTEVWFAKDHEEEEKNGPVYGNSGTDDGEIQGAQS